MCEEYSSKERDVGEKSNGNKYTGKGEKRGGNRPCQLKCSFWNRVRISGQTHTYIHTRSIWRRRDGR